MGGAARLDHEHVVLDQLAAQEIMQAVLGDAGIVAARQADHTPDAAGDDGVVQRPEGAAVLSALHVLDIFVGKAGDHRRLA